tara:strand:- start:195 stop:1289 length:1095 start_codon:yes stop_codon:yes gene_type:complete
MALDNILTVVIPCRNEENYIAKCLESLVACSFDKNTLEVFVCDGVSDDNTQEIVKSYERKYDFIHLLINDRRTTPFALNLGIERSTSDFVAILGAHAEVSSDYFSQCVADFQLDEKIGCTGGLLINEYEDELSEAIGIAQSSSFGVGNAHFRTGAKSGCVDTVAFGTYRKSMLDEIGYFDEELVRNQDDELNYRVIKNGWKIYLNTGVTALYYVRGSFSKLYKQYWQYGYWKVFVNKKHAAVTSVRQLVPALFVLGVVLFICTEVLASLASVSVIGSVASFFSLALFFSIGFYLILSFIIGINLWTNKCDFEIKKRRESLSTPFFVMFSFFILHFSYGLGYWKGILDFLIKGKGPTKKSENLTR